MKLQINAKITKFPALNQIQIMAAGEIGAVAWVSESTKIQTIPLAAQDIQDQINNHIFGDSYQALSKLRQLLAFSYSSMSPQASEAIHEAVVMLAEELTVEVNVYEPVK
jgi:hypothetical protein